MRKAEIDAAWLKCRKDTATFFVAGIECGGVVPKTLVLSSRIAALMGPNGIGKSRLMKAVNDLMGGHTAAPSPLQAVSGTFRGVRFRAHSGQAAPDQLSIELIDVSREVHLSTRYILEQEQFEELRDQFATVPVVGDRLSAYRHVCMRGYGSLAIREIEAPVAATSGDDLTDDEVIPFFEVEADGITYDSRTMGLGELCACYSLWRLFRSPRGSLLLFDEPDSHLSPASRSALIDVIAVVAAERDHVVIVSSHSAELLARLCEHEILVLGKDRTAGTNRHELALAENRRDVMRRLGLSTQARVVVAVEDVDAAEVLRQVLNRHANGLDRYFDIQVVPGGATELVKLAALFPSNALFVKTIAMLDGDKRADYGSLADVMFLPGNEDPIFAAAALARSQPSRLADLLNVDEDRMVDALDAASSRDHHDFCANLIRELGITATVPVARSALVKSWLDSPSVQAAAKDVCAALVNILNSIPIE